MTDYYGYRTKRTVILGFSSHTKDLFSEMRKYAANFEETAIWQSKTGNTSIAKNIRWAQVTIWAKANITAG
jgi:hypothetical protein